MIPFLFRRTLGTIPVLLLITFLVFSLIQLAPGDPATLLMGEFSSQEEIAEARALWGLDEPTYVQYFRFISAAAQGDFGRSFRYSQPVIDVILQRLPATLELAVVSTLFAVVIAVPFGIWAGANPNSWIDNVASTVGFFGISMPNFWMGIMLILIIAGYFELLPTSGRETFGMGVAPITGFTLVDSLLRLNWNAFRDALAHIALPAITLGTNMIGIILRVTRSAVIEIMHEDYITTARAKGQRERVVLAVHALRNALVVIVTVVGLELGSLLSGAIIVETVFSWPGLGTLLIEGLSSRDYPLVTGLVLVYTAMFVVVNLLIDLFYAVIDPRVRFD